MRLTSRGGRNRWLRNAIKLALGANWLESMTAVIRRRPRLVITTALPGLGFWVLVLTALFDIAWLVTWSLIAIRYRFSLAIFLASFPVLKWLLLLAANHSGHTSRNDPAPVPAAIPPPSAFWQHSTVAVQPGFGSEEPSHHNLGERGPGEDVFRVLVQD